MLDKEPKKIEPPHLLAHLNEDQVSQLYMRYHSGEDTKLLAVEYKLTSVPHHFYTIFPAIKRNDHVCPYCDTSMYANPISRTAAKSATRIIVCPSCQHSVYLDPVERVHTHKKCSCQNCVAATKSRILLHYSPDKHPPTPYTTLTFTQKLYLLATLRAQSDANCMHIQPIDEPFSVTPITPTRVIDLYVVDELYESRAILVDPTSNIAAFSDTEQLSFDTWKVRWLPNVTIDGISTAELNELSDALYSDFKQPPEPEWKTEINRAMFFVATEEVMQAIYFWCDELRVVFSAEVKTRETINHLLHDFSVSECLYFAKKSVDDAHLYFQRGHAKNKTHAGNIIPGSMLRLGERAIAERWNVPKFKRHAQLHRSALSLLIHGVLLPSEDSGFTKAPGRYWSDEIVPRYFPEPTIRQERSLACNECGSTAITSVMIDNAITINCKDCGARQVFLKT